MEECTALWMERVAIPLNWGYFNQNMLQDLELPYVYPTKKVHCYKLTSLMNLSKIPRLNFPWKISGKWCIFTTKFPTLCNPNPGWRTKYTAVSYKAGSERSPKIVTFQTYHLHSKIDMFWFNAKYHFLEIVFNFDDRFGCPVCPLTFCVSVCVIRVVKYVWVLFSNCNSWLWFFQPVNREVVVVGKPPRSPVMSRRSCGSPSRAQSYSPSHRVGLLPTMHLVWHHRTFGLLGNQVLSLEWMHLFFSVHINISTT